MLETLLSHGYFPKELPPSFSSIDFGDVVRRKGNNIPEQFSTGGHVSVPSIHNSARPGLLRRKLSIPNPVNMLRVSSTLTANWAAIQQHIEASPLSLTTPTFGGGNRALQRRRSLDALPELSAATGSNSRYILKADISRFYPSVYTHSIPWAFHTKVAAKSQKGPALFGNSIDKAIRDGQDQQTMGIPIGPDTSLVIAEAILTCVDLELNKRIELNGFRYIDDFHLGFDTIGEAEDALSIIQELLNEFELALNPLKTDFIELPANFENIGISELRAVSIRYEYNNQKSDILHYFNKAFHYSKEYPREPILKFAVSRLLSEDIHEKNYNVFENLLLQCAIAQPSCLKYVNNHIVKYNRIGYKQEADKIEEVLNKAIFSEASSGHENEVANCLWGLLALNLKITEASAVKVIQLKDPVCAVMLTDLKEKMLVKGTPDWTPYQDYMTKDEIKGGMWMFVYESLKRGWFPSKYPQSPIDQHDCFRFLKNNNVNFYDSNLAQNYQVPSPDQIGDHPNSISG